MVKHYIKGVKYNMQVDPFDEALGIVEMKIGQVNTICIYYQKYITNHHTFFF